MAGHSYVFEEYMDFHTIFRYHAALFSLDLAALSLRASSIYCMQPPQSFFNLFPGAKGVPFMYSFLSLPAFALLKWFLILLYITWTVEFFLNQLQVFEEYMDFTLRYSQLIEKLPTRAFFCPLDEDEEVEIELGKGVAAHIKYKVRGSLMAALRGCLTAALRSRLMAALRGGSMAALRGRLMAGLECFNKGISGRGGAGELVCAC